MAVAVSGGDAGCRAEELRRAWDWIAMAELSGRDC